MNYKIPIVIVSVFICTTAYSQTSMFDELKIKAKSQNKDILLVFSGSDWCAPCIQFKRRFIDSPAFKTFATEKLEVYNADFPRKKANQLTANTKAENEKLADQYNPNGNFPMILLLDSAGSIIKKWQGLPAISVEKFIKELQ